MKKFTLLAIIYSGIGVAFFAYLFYSEYGFLPLSFQQIPALSLSILLANLMGAIIFFVNDKLDNIIGWKKFFFSRFATGFIANVLLVSSILFGAGYIIISVFIKSDFIIVYNQFHEEVWKLGILILITLFIYEVFYGWFYSYRYFATTQVEQLQQNRLQMELQFESLKSQISPHYLFNCLNTISSLLYKDKDVAEEFIRRMADTFRYVIDNQKRKLVTLREEIGFVKSYYYLLQVRYPENLKIDINLPASLLETLVPPLAIQMLLENAIKHNEISKHSPLFIYISAQDNTYINVSSTKTVVNHKVESFQVGLSNIKNRYHFFTTKKIVIKDMDKYVVQLPVINNDQALVTSPSTIYSKE